MAYLQGTADRTTNSMLAKPNSRESTGKTLFFNVRIPEKYWEVLPVKPFDNVIPYTKDINGSHRALIRFLKPQSLGEGGDRHDSRTTLFLTGLPSISTLASWHREHAVFGLGGISSDHDIAMGVENWMAVTPMPKMRRVYHSLENDSETIGSINTPAFQSEGIKPGPVAMYAVMPSKKHCEKAFNGNMRCRTTNDLPTVMVVPLLIEPYLSGKLMRRDASGMCNALYELLKYTTVTGKPAAALPHSYDGPANNQDKTFLKTCLEVMTEVTGTGRCGAQVLVGSAFMHHPANLIEQLTYAFSVDRDVLLPMSRPDAADFVASESIAKNEIVRLYSLFTGRAAYNPLNNDDTKSMHQFKELIAWARAHVLATDAFVAKLRTPMFTKLGICTGSLFNTSADVNMRCHIGDDCTRAPDAAISGMKTHAVHHPLTTMHLNVGIRKQLNYPGWIGANRMGVFIITSDSGRHPSNQIHVGVIDLHRIINDPQYKTIVWVANGGRAVLVEQGKDIAVKDILYRDVLEDLVMRRAIPLTVTTMHEEDGPASAFAGMVNGHTNLRAACTYLKSGSRRVPMLNGMIFRRPLTAREREHCAKWANDTLRPNAWDTVTETKYDPNAHLVPILTTADEHPNIFNELATDAEARVDAISKEPNIDAMYNPVKRVTEQGSLIRRVGRDLYELCLLWHSGRSKLYSGDCDLRADVRRVFADAWELCQAFEAKSPQERAALIAESLNKIPTPNLPSPEENRGYDKGSSNPVYVNHANLYAALSALNDAQRDALFSEYTAPVSNEAKLLWKATVEMRRSVCRNAMSDLYYKNISCPHPLQRTGFSITTVTPGDKPDSIPELAIAVGGGR
jgi:hypothetical protein